MDKNKPPSSPRSTLLWVIQNDAGMQTGPITTDEVLQRISDGIVRGTERIRQYPEGKWFSISKEPKFYDRLLQELENSIKGKRKVEVKKEEPPPVQPSAITEEPPLPKAKSSDRAGAKGGLKKQDEPILKKTPPKEIAQEQPPVIELKSIESLKRVAKKKSMAAPFAILGAAAAVVILAILWPQQQDESGVLHLLVPKTSNTVSLSPAQQQSLMNKMGVAYQADTFEGYISAQNQLITLIEGAPHLVEPRGFLCLVYKELWPFVKQDSFDLEAVFQMTKSARGLDPAGLNGVYCEISKLIILGKFKDARGLIDHTLNNPQIKSSAILFTLKAEILAADLDIKAAALYAESAAKNFPQSVKANFLHALFLSQSLQDNEAVAAFQKAMALNPKHKGILIEYGSLIYNRFKRLDKALNFLSAGLSLPFKVQRSTEAKGHFTIARVYAESNQPKKALEHASIAYSLHPGDSRYRDLLVQLGGDPTLTKNGHYDNELVLLGDQYFRAGDFLSAQAVYKTAFEVDPSNAMAALKAGKSLWQLSQAQEAIVWLNKSIRADAKLALTYYVLADYLTQRFNFQAALDILNKGAKNIPNKIEIYRGFGLLEYRRKSFLDAITYLEKALKIYSNDVETLILLAKAYSEVKEFQKAQNLILKAIELDGTNTEAQVVYSKVVLQYQGAEAALFHVQDLINRFSYTIDFRLALAEIYRESSRQSQAIDVYQQVILAEPKNKKAYMGLGGSLKEQGLFDKALKAYLEAAVIDPSDAEPLVGAGNVYFESNRYSDAITQYKRALRINPTFPLIHFNIGRAAFLSGSYDLALEAAHEEKKKNPNLADPYLLSAEVLMVTRDYQKCATEYQQAVKIRPQGTEIYVKLSKCLRLSGSLDIAESMLNIAASQESGVAEIYKEQGAIFEQKGDRSSGAASYCKYLSLSPNAPDRAEVRTRIELLGGVCDE